MSTRSFSEPFDDAQDGVLSVVSTLRNPECNRRSSSGSDDDDDVENEDEDDDDIDEVLDTVSSDIIPISTLVQNPRPKRRFLESDDEDEDGVSDAPTTIARKTLKPPPPKKRRVKGKRGVLQRLLEMPIDLLFEILGKVDPIDVLHLARTSKELRAVLMHASAAFIWREALSNFPDLPACPRDLDEPQWVDLVFGKNCQLCSRKSYRPRTIWELNFRACTHCLETQFIVRPRQKSNLPYNLVSVIPHFEITTGPRGSRGDRVHGATLEEWEREYKELKGEKARAKWVHRRLLQMKVKSQHALKCEVWVANQEYARAREERVICQERKEKILMRLESCGYAQEDIGTWRSGGWDLWDKESVKALLKKDITDRVWDNAEDSILQHADLSRQWNFSRNHGATINSRNDLIVELRNNFAKSQHPNAIVIPAGNLFLTKEVQILLAETPLNKPMTLSSFDPVASRLPQISLRWELQEKQNLVALMEPHLLKLLSPAPVTDSTLELAISAFKCDKCCNRVAAMDYTWALMHKCATHGSPRERTTPGYYPKEYLDLLSFADHTNLTAWNVKHRPPIKFNTDAFGHAVKVFEILGHDPKTTTIQQMNTLDEIAECTSCSNFDDGRLMLNWRLMVQHQGSCKNPKLVKVDPITAADVRGRMLSDQVRARYNKYGSDTDYHVCAHCRLETDSKTLRKHLGNEHGIHNPTDADVVVLLEAPGPTPYHYYKFENTTYF